MFSPVFAEMATVGTCPPQPSTKTSFSAKPCLTFSMFAPGLSILFIAIINGVSSHLMHLSASRVCGFTPSSADTTSRAMSATFAPLSLMEQKASCPGVSRKVIFLLSFLFPSEISTSASYADKCCVMPPASPAVKFVFLI